MRTLAETEFSSEQQLTLPRPIRRLLAVRAAVARFAAHRADFSDCLALELARAAEELPFATFDRQAAKLPGAVRP